MDLATGVVVAHPKWTPCKMTDIVVKCVEKMAANQTIKYCNFFIRKCQLMLMQPKDLLLEVVRGGNVEEDEVIENDGQYPNEELPSLIPHDEDSGDETNVD